jgi:hypothetical protein
MNQEKLSEKESIEIIRKMIELSKNKIVDDGKHFILWGILVFMATVLQYIMYIFYNMGDKSGLSWFLMFIGIPISIVLGKKGEKKQTVLTDLYENIWLGFGISIGILIFTCLYLNASMAPFLLTVIGFAVFVSYQFVKFVPYLISSIFFWASTLFLVVNQNRISPIEQTLIYGICVFLGYVIPGILLNLKFKRQNIV